VALALLAALVPLTSNTAFLLLVASAIFMGLAAALMIRFLLPDRVP